MAILSQPRTRYWCELVFEEIVSNIIRHGYADSQKHRISTTVAIHGDRVELYLEDDGVPFDPRQPVPAPCGGGPSLRLWWSRPAAGPLNCGAH